MPTFAKIETIQLIMKKFFILALSAVIALASCTKEDGNLDGRWNAARGEGMDDYAFSLIFKGDKLTMYVIAWGQRYEGTYTYADDVITYNITNQYQAYSNVSYDDDGNMTSYHWGHGDMDQNTFKLAAGYDWYDMKKARPDLYEDNKEMYGSFTFHNNGDGTATTNLGFGTPLVKQK